MIALSDGRAARSDSSGFWSTCDGMTTSGSRRALTSLAIGSSIIRLRLFGDARPNPRHRRGRFDWRTAQGLACSGRRGSRRHRCAVRSGARRSLGDGRPRRSFRLTALMRDARIRAVVHAGAISGPMVAAGDPHRVMSVNVGGAQPRRGGAASWRRTPRRAVVGWRVWRSGDPRSCARRCAAQRDGCLWREQDRRRDDSSRLSP